LLTKSRIYWNYLILLNPGYDPVKMESVKKILHKIEQPLLFASQHNFHSLSHIKDLGKSLSNLLCILKGALSVERKNEQSQLIDELLSIFSDYDCQKLEQKKLRIENAIKLLNQIKPLINSFNISTTGQYQDKHIYQKISDLTDIFAKLTTPVQYLKGVGPKMAQRFLAKNIITVEDLLYFLPRAYEDRREIKTIRNLEVNKIQTVIGKVILTEFRYYGKKRILEVTVSDNTANLIVKWFKGQMSYLFVLFKKGIKVILTGNVTPSYAGKAMIHPDYEIMDEKEVDLLNFKRIVPVYSETEGLHQKYFRKIMYQALENYARYFTSLIPADICRKRNLMNIQEAMRDVHFPSNKADLNEYNSRRSVAHYRLIYDEFFFFQLGMAVKKSGRIFEKGIAFRSQCTVLNKYFTLLPFSLTSAQKRVIQEIHVDMSKKEAMNRLLQGDVGSGKTIVAMAAMIIACENNYQAALMAPTEILAKQHFKNIDQWAASLNLKVVLLTGNMNIPDRKKTLDQINSGLANIVVGTHAIIQENVDFHKLGLVVTDEQHRFGVMQRATLRNKGSNPDVLVMTATPIPRTLAMTVYGDLDVSVIDEMPAGKKPVRTILMNENKRSRVYELIAEELAKDNQAFIVYPLVEQSENLDLKDATNMAEHLQKEIFPDYKVGLIHGKMKEKDKDSVMQNFFANEINVLVSTTVIEVGIDVPRASVMVIEHAERFGLSQLHQLRGRVGRRDTPSLCILISDYACSLDARKRLKIMEKTTDGFTLAEEDLAIRGPGDFLGTRQSGLPDFKIASVIHDARILNDAREDAFKLIADDPFLESPQHLLLREILLWKWRGKLDLARTG